MDSALKRSVDHFMRADEDIFHLSSDIYTAELNKSQKKAVATVSNPSFKEGFFLVHGPPGVSCSQLL